MLTAAETTAKMAEHMNFDQQFNDEQALAIQFKVTLELVQMFVNTFLATGDDGYLDTAITLATNLPSISESVDATRDEIILNLTNIKAYWNGLSSQILGSRSAVTAEGIGEGVNTPMAAYQLSRLYTRRYDECGGSEELAKAMEQTEEALGESSAGDPNRWGMLQTMGRLAHDRFERLGFVKDLERSIQCHEEALAVTPADHPTRATLLENLSMWLATRGSQLGTLQDIEDAIQHADESLAATPADHLGRALQLKTLSWHFYSRYRQLKDVIGHEHSGTLKDLEKAVTLAEEAVAMTPANHPSQGELLYTLGRFVFIKFCEMGNMQDCLYALGVNQDAWSCSLSAPTTRIKAASYAALILFGLGRWQESSSLLEDAVKLLPTVSPRFLGRNDQEHQLSALSNIAAQAISAALAAGKQASHCLTFLELGRGIINGLIMDCRSDISELKSKNPDMFERFDHLRIEIDSRSAYDETTYEQVSKRRMEAAEELEETLVNIRLLPGFSGFLSPPNPTDLMAAAEEGSIIIVNCTCYRSDAILVSKSVIKSLPLPLLLCKEAYMRMKSLRTDMIRGLNSTYRARNRALRQFLLWLWDAVVGPIFQELQLNPVAADITPPRIWWIGVGPLSMAPFHAAGNHSEGSTDNTISRAISSYISTIKALSFAREKSLELLSRTDSKVLLVAMPGTPGESPLGSASAEVSDIAGEIEKSTHATVLEHPSASEVLEKLQSCEAVHFACHGITDARNPSNSHLLLFKHNGSAAATADPLTVEKMSSTRIKTAQIAYLSACSTVDNVSEKLSGESIHIASGFQLAGFSHVLGTMWKSNDVACRDVAVAFYRSLLDGQGDKGHGKVSFSFHQAVKELRQKRLRQPIIWTSFIHTGA
ncbi:hypothetical protein Q9L58_010144 [Maublancomyces gigas]|uniref:CHAT domain-containing protein n=1 Tax=Discina gigas TaxID=1032678 RepID=A0ABR3G550_9PEZI